MIKTLTKLDVPKSLLIVIIISVPIVLYFNDHTWFDYNSAKLYGLLAMIYFFVAFILYLFLYLISHLPKSEKRRKLVLFTRIFIRFHISIAIIGSFLIIFHSTLMLNSFRSGLHTTTGLLSLFALGLVLFTGYLRKMKSSGKRRRFHRYFAFLFVGLAIIHLMV